MPLQKKTNEFDIQQLGTPASNSNSKRTSSHVMRKNTKRFLVRHRTSFEPVSSRTKVSKKKQNGAATASAAAAAARSSSSKEPAVARSQEAPAELN